MARKKRRPKVFYNGAVDTWSNDSMNEPYLMPGTEAYAAYQESLKKQVGEDVDDDLDRNQVFCVVPYGDISMYTDRSPSVMNTKEELVAFIYG